MTDAPETSRDTARADTARAGSPWDAVLYDLDGTLADTVPLILHCYREMMRFHRNHDGDPSLWLTTIGRPLPDSLAQIASGPKEAEAMLETYRRVQEEVHDAMVVAFEGIHDVLNHTIGLGSPLAIVTSKGRPMTERSMQICRLDGLFPVIVTADDVTRAKPHPEPVHRALERLGVSVSERVLFVGDSLHDVEAGHAAGIRTAAVTWGALGRGALEVGRPHYMVERPADLIPILQDGPSRRVA